MSRQPNLPPRCPFQKKPYVHPCQEAPPKLQKYPSQSFVLEDQPSWLDELLSEQDSDHLRPPLRRSTSDSAALLGDHDDFFAGAALLKNDGVSSGFDVYSSMYGPNSPRQRTFPAIPESSAASTGSFPSTESSNLDEYNSEAKTQKRHSGQRSRVRKLQYIAELERTVETLQTIESDLAVNVASLLQKRVALSLENSKLKQMLVRLRQEKSLMEGQYKSMKKEAERLKSCMQRGSGSSSRASARSNLSWKMLDMANLNIN